MSETVVLGAGLTGLGFGISFKDAVIYELCDKIGGHAKSVQLAGFGFDQGAHIAHSKDKNWLNRICTAAGDVHQIHSSNVFNFWNGLQITYPVQNHLHELPLEYRTKALLDFFHSQYNKEEFQTNNYESWCLKQYGEYLTNTFYRPYTKKYWKEEMKALDTDWLGGRLLPAQIEKIIKGALGPIPETQAVFSTFHYPSSGGFGAFLTDMGNGLDIRLNKKAIHLDLANKVVSFTDGEKTNYDNLISTIPLTELVDIISDVPKEIQEAREKLKHTQLCVVDIVLEGEQCTPAHWFYIYDVDMPAARVGVPSNLSGYEGTKTALQAEIFFGQDEQVDLKSVQEKVISKLPTYLDISAAHIKQVQTRLIKYAYIVSNHDRKTASKYILKWLEKHDIISTGLYGAWEYIWSDKAFETGYVLGQELRRNR